MIHQLRGVQVKERKAWWWPIDNHPDYNLTSELKEREPMDAVKYERWCCTVQVMGKWQKDTFFREKWHKNTNLWDGIQGKQQNDLLNVQAQRIDNERNVNMSETPFLMAKNNRTVFPCLAQRARVRNPDKPKQHNQTLRSFTEVKLYLTSKRETQHLNLGCKTVAFYKMSQDRTGFIYKKEERNYQINILPLWAYNKWNIYSTKKKKKNIDLYCCKCDLQSHFSLIWSTHWGGQSFLTQAWIFFSVKFLVACECVLRFLT